MSRFGFGLDDFPGNMTVVMARMDKETLIESGLCPTDYSINNSQPSWLVIAPMGEYDPTLLSTLAERISSTHSCRCIDFSYGDASDALVYTLYDDGERVEAYWFSPDYSEEMGDHAAKAGPDETIVRNGEQEFYYFSKDEHPDNETLEGGSVFLNQLFVEQEAELAWDYLPQ